MGRATGKLAALVGPQLQLVSGGSGSVVHRGVGTATVVCNVCNCGRIAAVATLCQNTGVAEFSFAHTIAVMLPN